MAPNISYWSSKKVSRLTSYQRASARRPNLDTIQTAGTKWILFSCFVEYDRQSIIIIIIIIKFGGTYNFTDYSTSSNLISVVLLDVLVVYFNQGTTFNLTFLTKNDCWEITLLLCPTCLSLGYLLKGGNLVAFMTLVNVFLGFFFLIFRIFFSLYTFVTSDTSNISLLINLLFIFLLSITLLIFIKTLFETFLQIFVFSYT